MTRKNATGENSCQCIGLRHIGRFLMSIVSVCCMQARAAEMESAEGATRIMETSAFEKTPSAHTGKAIQAAIDAVHNAGGGNVRLERAVYPSGTLHLKSNVTLIVPEGAVILGGANASCYDDVIDRRIGKSPDNGTQTLP